MPTRFFLMIFIAWLIVIFTAPATCGHNFKKGPMKKGCRKVYVKWVYKFICSLYIAIAGMRTSKVTQDCDYSYYLGPNYKNNYKQIARTSTIVPNHSCWLDAVIMIKYFCPAFAPKILFQGMPLFGKLCDLLDAIYIPKGQGPDALKNALSVITDR